MHNEGKKVQVETICGPHVCIVVAKEPLPVDSGEKHAGLPGPLVESVLHSEGSNQSEGAYIGEAVMLRMILVVILAALFGADLVFARDVTVRGYYRKDGTYVRPHVRSSPNSYRSDNYGPSRDSSQLMNPTARDADNDGTPNYLDSDDDNDGAEDNSDDSQYSPP